MNVLLLGVGMQGKAALYDLANDPRITRIVAADRDLDTLRREVRGREYGERVLVESVDATRAASVDRLMAMGHDVVIDLLPVPFIGIVAESAVRHRVHVVNTFYVVPALAAVAGEAAARGVAILPEFGMDPGIDLVMLGDMVSGLDEVHEILSYGAGVPAPEAADNPIRYKVSWTFEGVLRSYMRPAVLIEDGRVRHLGDREQFRAEHLHTVDIDGVGALEAFANGDAVAYVQRLGLDERKLTRAGRWAMRYPGHGAFWRVMVDLGLLEDDEIDVAGQRVNKRRYLATALEPRLRYGPDERDLSIIRVEVAGIRDGRTVRLVREVVDRRDLETGLSAMSRTVGYTAAIGARMLVDGTVTKRGLLSPVTDVPYSVLKQALGTRGVDIVEYQR